MDPSKDRGFVAPASFATSLVHPPSGIIMFADATDACRSLSAEKFLHLANCQLTR
jgi:hypothetical protein